MSEKKKNIKNSMKKISVDVTIDIIKARAQNYYNLYCKLFKKYNQQKAAGSGLAHDTESRMLRLKVCMGDMFEKIFKKKSAAAAYFRIIAEPYTWYYSSTEDYILEDTCYSYPTLTELINDRCLIEEVHPKGFSSFDKKIPARKVRYLGKSYSSDREHDIKERDEILNLKIPVEEMDLRGIRTLLAFSDAKTLSGEVGEKIIARIDLLLKECVEKVKATISNGAEAEACREAINVYKKTKESAQILNAEAIKYYNKMIGLIENTATDSQVGV